MGTSTLKQVLNDLEGRVITNIEISINNHSKDLVCPRCFDHSGLCFCFIEDRIEYGLLQYREIQFGMVEHREGKLVFYERTVPVKSRYDCVRVSFAQHCNLKED